MVRFFVTPEELAGECLTTIPTLSRTCLNIITAVTTFVNTFSAKSKGHLKTDVLFLWFFLFSCTQQQTGR